MNVLRIAPAKHLSGRRSWQAAGAALLAFALCVPMVRAADEGDLPTRVGRIADVGGELFHAPEDRASDWSMIGLNYPVTSGDNLWVAEGGRAEVDFGAGQIRLADATNIHVSRLDDRTVAIFLAQGRAILRLRVLDPGEVARIDTPHTQIVLTRPGLYRVDVSPDVQRTVLVVREGEATLPSLGAMQQVLPGQSAAAEGFDATRVDVRNGIATDGFDTWSANRDRRYERRGSTSYVSREMVGSADLEEYGRWESDTTYGAVWYPTLVDAGWAPYSQGRWTWVGAYGWTWVDNAPWGYAPSHYGRWVHTGGRWGWCPGNYIARPVWSPAMVGWLGGPGWGLSLTFGAPVYGWVPLAWGEPFHPWWNRCSDNCWQHYNRPYAVRTVERNSRPATQFVNIHKPNAVTAVPGAVFSGSKPVSSHLVAVKPHQVSGAPMLASAPALARPGAGHIALVKPGASNTPMPASTYVPPGRGGVASVKPAGSITGSSRTVSVPAPSRGSPFPSSVPGASKPAPATSAAAPATREYRGAPGAPSTSLSAPGTKPAPMAAAPTQRSSQPMYAAPVQRGSGQTYSVPVPPAPTAAAPTQRGSQPMNAAPVQRESGQTYAVPVPRNAPQTSVPTQRAAPPPAPSSAGIVMPVQRAAPQPPAAVQYAPPPVVVRSAPPQASQTKPQAEGNSPNVQDRGYDGGRSGYSVKPGQSR